MSGSASHVTSTTPSAPPWLETRRAGLEPRSVRDIRAGYGLSLIGVEGAGEVQTPVRGAAADRLRPGDRVWLRHAKAGELAERFTDYHVLDGDRLTAVPTYRGEGQCFG